MTPSEAPVYARHEPDEVILEGSQSRGVVRVADAEGTVRYALAP